MYKRCVSVTRFAQLALAQIALCLTCAGSPMEPPSAAPELGQNAPVSIDFKVYAEPPRLLLAGRRLRLLRRERERKSMRWEPTPVSTTYCTA